MVISVIIPTYAPGEYIYDCLKSLSMQTADSNLIEVVVVLNGVKEPYFSGIQSYLENTTLRYKLLYTEKKGVSYARNTGLDALELSDSQYVVFLDDDDKLSENFIQDLAKKASPGRVVAANSKSFFDGQAMRERKGYVSACYEKNVNTPYNIFKYRCLLSSVCAKLFPVNVIGKVRFNTRFSVGEDALFVFAISDKIREIILSSDDVYYLRRLRTGSASRSQRSRLNKLVNAIRLSVAYTGIYLKKPFDFNFLFFLSRIIATFVHVIKRDNSVELNRLKRKVNP